MSLLAQVLEGVLGEALELVAHHPLGGVELLLQRLQRLAGPLGDDLVAAEDLGAIEAEDPGRP